MTPQRQTEMTAEDERLWVQSLWNQYEIEKRAEAERLAREREAARAQSREIRALRKAERVRLERHALAAYMTKCLLANYPNLRERIAQEILVSLFVYAQEQFALSASRDA